MTTRTNKKPASGSARNKLDAKESKNAEAEVNTKYDSGWFPILLLAIPFVLILIYGYFS